MTVVVSFRLSLYGGFGCCGRAAGLLAFNIGCVFATGSVRPLVVGGRAVGCVAATPFTARLTNIKRTCVGFPLSTGLLNGCVTPCVYTLHVGGTRVMTRHGASSALLRAVGGSSLRIRTCETGFLGAWVYHGRVIGFEAVVRSGSKQIVCDESLGGA